MSKDRLLSDEELRNEVEYCVTMEYKAPQGEPAASRIDRLMRMFNTQKRLYAESVIGEDEPEDSDDYPFEYGKQYGRNELRNELRTKLAKWLNQPTVNQSASVSRSDEGGESTKGGEE